MSQEVLMLPVSQIDPQWTKEEWLKWLADESTPDAVRHRFGTDAEARVYWTDDYYEKLERWWSLPENRLHDPIEVEIHDGVVRIIDGWHRVAISHKLGIEFVPVRYSCQET